MSYTVAVVGASGFVGRSVVLAIKERGCRVVNITAPRLSVSEDRAIHSWEEQKEHLIRLVSQMSGCEVVVNCAGNPDASSRDVESLFGANAALPGLAAHAAARAGACRFVHISSAAVQGAAPCLDATEATRAHSTYAQSKVVGERAVQLARSPESTVIYRPPSVHSPERRVTRGIRRLATSQLSSVVGPGIAATPQAHIRNVGAAAAELALTGHQPPPIVIHPWEGWTTGTLLRLFGDGLEPRHIPAQFGPTIKSALHLCARSNHFAANARRVEMMWFGQDQDRSWLTSIGWSPPATRTDWEDLVSRINTSHNANNTGGN